MANLFISNPCGLSFDRLVEIIEDKVRYAKYNGREEIIEGLMDDNFSYEEADTIANFYFRIYNNLAENKKIRTLGSTLTAQQKTEKKIVNLAVDFLNGKVGAFSMGEEDFKHLESIYANEAKAETPTLKARYTDEAVVFIQKFMPTYTDELFRSFVYAKPLLSGVFFIKSVVSNIWSQLERVYNSWLNSIWNGKQADFRVLNGFNDLGNAAMLNVFKGGIPATTLFQAESGFDPTRGRVEEFGIEGTKADANWRTRSYYRLMNHWSRISNRLNAAPDTRGIFHNAERHYYELSKEFYMAEGSSYEEANQKALADMELDDIHKATEMATAKFNELGLPLNTTEFNVAVAEYRRKGREDVRWRKALQLSKNDFWKKNMMVASELGFGDYGLFGLKTQLFVRARDYLEKKTKHKLASAFNLSAFGFLNGAANFAEDALERVPVYAAIKWAFLRSKGKKINNEDFQRDIARRQKDLIAKNISTATFFVLAQLLEKLVCPERHGRETGSQISGGRTQIGICGIPALIPPQMLATYKMYKIITEAISNKDDAFGALLNVLPVLAQSSNIGLGGTIDKLSTSITNWSVAAGPIRRREEGIKMVNEIIGLGTGLGNSFLPIPSRAISEAATIVQRARGFTQKQQALPFAIDEVGRAGGVANSILKVSLAGMANVTGISDIAMAALGSQKQYAIDWQGRKVMQFRGSDITGSGVRYTDADDILATAKVLPPYVYRLQKVEASKADKERGIFLGVGVTQTTKKQRYLTDKEYFNVSEALGNFNKEFFKQNKADLVARVKEDRKFAANFMESLFDKTKRLALDAIEKRGMTDSKDIEGYIWSKWRGKMSVTETELEQSEK